MWKYFWFILIVLTACTPTIDQPLPTFAPLPGEILTIIPWETFSGVLNTVDETNEWQFVGRVGDQVRLRAIARGATVAMRVTLRGQLLGEGDNIELTLPENEIYRVSVRLVSGMGQYDLGLSYPNLPNPNDPTDLPQVVGVPTPTPPYTELGEFIRTLSVTAEVPGLLTAPSPQHIYTFDGQVGAVVTFELLRIAGTLDPFLRLYAPDRSLVALDDNGLGDVNARLLNIVLPQTGQYSIQVSGRGFFGDYLLRFLPGVQPIQVDPLPTIEPTVSVPYVTPTVGIVVGDSRLTDHAPALGNIARPGDFQRYSIILSAGQVFSVRIEPYVGSTIIPQIEVFSPEGELLANTNAQQTNAPITWATGMPANSDGAYTIIVTGVDDSIGAYLVSAGIGQTVADVYQGTGETNIQLVGQITQYADRHTWVINLNPGDVISVAASPSQGLIDPVVEVATVDGVVLYRDDNSGSNRAALIRLAEIREPNTYLVRVYDARGDQLGSYTLLWRYVTLSPTATPRPNIATLLNVRDTVAQGQYQFYTFQGRAGQTVRIQVIGDATLDAVASLLDPNSNIVAESDDSEGTLNPLMIYTLMEDGSYSVRVNGYLSGGQFDLSVGLLLNTP